MIRTMICFGMFSILFSCCSAKGEEPANPYPNLNDELPNATICKYRRLMEDEWPEDDDICEVSSKKKHKKKTFHTPQRPEPPALPEPSLKWCTFIKMEYDSHQYIYFINHQDASGNSLIHDPSCSCYLRYR